MFTLYSVLVITHIQFLLIQIPYCFPLISCRKILHVPFLAALILSQLLLFAVSMSNGVFSANSTLKLSCHGMNVHPKFECKSQDVIPTILVVSEDVALNCSTIISNICYSFGYSFVCNSSFWLELIMHSPHFIPIKFSVLMIAVHKGLKPDISRFLAFSRMPFQPYWKSCTCWSM